MSSYNFIRQSHVSQPTVTSDRFLTVTNDQGFSAYKNSDYYAVDDKQTISLVSPSTTVPSSLSNAQVDFKIENGSIDLLSFPVLRAQFLNSSGSNSSMSSLHLMISRIDVLSADGRILWNTNGQELYLSNLFLDKNTYQASCADMGLSTSYGQLATVVANGATIDLLMPIWGFFKSTKLFIEGINGPLIVRVYFNPSSFSVITGAEMTCQSLNFLLYGRSLKSASKRAIMDVYRSRIPLALSHLAVDRKTEAMSLTAGQNIRIVLSGLSGTCAFIIMTMRLASTSNLPASACTYLNVDTLDCQDNGGNSLIGAYARDYRSRRLLQAINLGNDASVVNHDAIWFSNDPVSSFSRGCNGGYAILTGSEALVFKTASTLPSANYLIDIRAYMFENTIINQGNIMTTRN
jgi:hypothetical protein